jgi:hypothetical protein
MVKLHNWSIVASVINVRWYLSPETELACIFGSVEGDPELHDGDTITSPIGSVCLDLGGEVFVSAPDGTTYQLMEVDPEYDDQYPHAVDRLLDNRAKEHV